MRFVREQIFRQRITETGRDCKERIKPPARLVDSFGDKVRRIIALELLTVLEWKMPLGERHRTGVEPGIDHFRRTLHRAAAMTLQGVAIDERLVWIEVVAEGRS